MSPSTRITATAVAASILPLCATARPASAAEPSLRGLGAPLAESGWSVPCEQALREVLPIGWRLEENGAVSGCAPVSWSSDDTALSLYERIAGEAGVSVIADVSAKTVTIEASPGPGVRRAQQAGGVSYQGPVAFVDTSVRVPLEAISNRYGLTLHCGTACDRAIPGPVTLELSGDIGQDTTLLEDALGPIEPLEIIEDPINATLDVVPARKATFAVEGPRPKPWWRRL